MLPTAHNPKLATNLQWVLPFLLGEKCTGSGSKFYKDLILKHKENPGSSTRSLILAICKKIRLAPSLHTLGIDTAGRNCTHLFRIRRETIKK